MAACAESVVMLLFEVYDGSAVTMRDNSAMAVCERLLKRAKLMSANGSTLQTDNQYTSMKLAKTMYQKYAWTICGTIVPIEKKARQDHDIPLLRLSNGTLHDVQYGWLKRQLSK